MPPKKAAKGAAGPSKKTDQKQKEKVIEDKTFGMKNKKGTKQQKFIKMVTTQVQQGNQKAKLAGQQPDKLKAREDKKKAAEELNMLFKPVEQRVGKGVDPKSVVCAFFKQGQCKKGDKCKFSHDLNIGRKGEKRSMYDDTATQDTMDTWDEDKLEEVVNKKHGDSNKSLPATSIICKYFLEALENSKYGWFWECPNGKGCHYRHALPPGFVLKKDKAKLDKVDEISLEELIEKERAALNSSNLTKVTLESFLIWKEKKRKEKIKKAAADSDKKKADYKAGKVLGISGREMFEFNPDLVIGDDDEADDVVYERDSEDEDETEIKDLSEMQNTEYGDDNETRKEPKQDDETNKLGEAAASDADTPITTTTAVNGSEEIDENLFDGEDLDLVEEELETLELDD